MGGRNKRSRDDILALMQVVYTGQDAAPLQQDTDHIYKCQPFVIIILVSTCMMVMGTLTERHRTVSHSMSAEDIWQRTFDEL